MKAWFLRMGQRFAGWMYGRYGTDALNRFITVLSLILMLLACIPPLWLLSLPALVLLIWSYARCFSRKIERRRQENERYLAIIRPVKGFFGLQKNKWRYRKTHRFFKCPQCRAVLRVPRKKGKIDVHCPRCGKITVKRT